MKTRFTALVVILSAIACYPSAQAEDWLQWRGPSRADRSSETGLLKSWPEEGPKQLWVNDKAGFGYAGFSIQGDKLYTLGLEDDTCFALCLNANTGKEVWRKKIGGKFENRWGDGPRSTPTIDGKNVYFLTAGGTLACLNAANGKKSWSCEMSEFGGKVPFWGYSESPLVDGKLVVCTPGGDEGAIVALNKSDGKLVWQTEDLTTPAHYSSLIVADWGGKHQYIQLLMDQVVGIDSADGSLLWTSPWEGRTAVIPTPIFKDGTVYVTSGYKVGSKAVQLNDQNEATEKWFQIDMQNHHGGVILVGDHVYGYSDKAGWACQDLETGEIVWNQNKREIRKGAVSYADGLFYHLQENDGQVILIKATPDGFEEISRFTLEPQTEQRSPMGKVWVHPVICNGKLYLRDQEFIHCYDLQSK
ncbi:MAG: PQQ-like beta-propeller repeat protein [Mariniblastus sp.]|nr:PQQ-like beta-propeller repeat protein [Mariniblastus sp.]